MHISVLQKEAVRCLGPKPNENFIDCTIGSGGHTFSILEMTEPNGKVLAIDRDPEIIRNLKLEIRNLKRVILICDNFANLEEIVKREKFKQVAGILFDLGMSSWHLEKSGRGFSFLKNEPLDMRYNPANPLTLLAVNRVRQSQKPKENKPLSGLTAEKIVNYWSKFELEKILKEYGEEKFTKKIVAEIVNARSLKPIKTSFQLKEIIKKATPVWYHRKKIHPATRTFQALRIAVNDELNNLKKALPQAIEILRFGGRLVVISFHSLEDRIVKNFLKEKNKENLIEILTKKPIRPTTKEIKTNPRSRSAKLRAIVKL